MHLDNNFPAPLQVLAFLGAATLAGTLMLASLYGFLRKQAWARTTALALIGSALTYLALVSLFAVFSHESTLERGVEKYFCETDCHLAYSITDVRWLNDSGAYRTVAVSVRTRFDETTISSRRPKDVPLTPNSRAIHLRDANGQSYVPNSSSGIALDTELIPGQSYVTVLEFQVPRSTSGLRLLITSTGGPLPLLIGNEMSVGHKKTYLAL